MGIETRAGTILGRAGGLQNHPYRDGRVLRVGAGGGFAAIYSGVTERKRVEEEIRAARDTAERALRDRPKPAYAHADDGVLGQLTAGIAHKLRVRSTSSITSP